MPGILPMKVIKVGSSAQSRIAQACDRCRSKKIRCDGIRPCCSQCANVGFECKTSDKLSRRAFPRGYTESLEERVRTLESETRELKELLDEKDEKIDMLSRLHSQSSQPFQLQSPRRTSTTSMESKDGAGESPEKEEIFKVQQSPYLLESNGEGSDSYFSGTSSSRTFIEAFKHKVQEKGQSTAEINTASLLEGNVKSAEDSADPAASEVTWKAPPRLLSDQLINVYFQEWAPLFPVVHRPTFLGLYERYVADPEQITDKAELAQLNLVFGIAALSSGTRSSDDLNSFQQQWKSAVNSILKDNSMATLQTLVLAQLFCVLQGDYAGLLTYKGLSTSLSARLGLHQSQKRFTLGTLTCETRKKVFWTLYTIDNFSAVILGLPKHIKDADVHCELPTDADDEYVTERGFQPTLPGESTKLSSALALFRAARILSKVLEEVFPAKTSYDLSLRKLAELSDELDAWSSSLAPHLRLQFAQDKPSTGTVNSRSPILSLAYHFIRALIQRPAICASSLGSRSSSSMITMANSCKHMIQIIQLLDERGLSFAFCLNRDEFLITSGFGLLFQGLNLEPNSKMLKDNHKMVWAVIDLLEKSAAPCASEFKQVTASFIPSAPAPIAKQKHQETPKMAKPPQLSRYNTDGAAQTLHRPTSSSSTSSTRKQLKAIASRLTASSSGKKPTLDVADHRRATVHNISLHPNGVPSQSQPSLQPPTSYDPSSHSRSEPARSPLHMFSRTASSSTTTPPSLAPPHLKPKPRQSQPCLTNLDYLSFGSDAEVPLQMNPHPVKAEPGPTDWEKLIGSLDNGQTNIYDPCYGGPPVDVSSFNTHQTNPSAHTLNDVPWSGDLWALSTTDTNTSNTSGLTTSSEHPDSVLSFSTDEGNLNSSNEDFTNATWNCQAAGTGTGVANDTYRGIMMPEMGQGDELHFDSSIWDNALNLQ
ncbi:DNA-binding transcription factor cat8 [Vermiconidia calcicola]|uniref:DNA-binding transcription factor cat8 n=1 Tax=Vermiconidia calcicola TaxID=1690605 RepID=A0ACC3NFE6_9PEZI|nr:DNA-binding transcription factor cat8 [Vermiconidia calcicola]